MQLYSAVSPLAEQLVRSLSPSSAGVPPKLREQQLSESGVDGEALWTSECASAGDDVSCFVQPTSEQLANLRAVSERAWVVLRSALTVPLPPNCMCRRHRSVAAPSSAWS